MTRAQFSGKNSDIAGMPTLLFTFPYTVFNSANGYLFQNIVGKFSRNAKERTIWIYSTLNQALGSAPSLSGYDSAVTTNTGALQVASFNATQTPNGTGNALTTISMGRGQTNSLSFDSGMLTLQTGATVPTSGNVYIYVSEVL